LGNSTWTVSGNWDHENVGTFNRDLSTVILNGSGKTLSASGTDKPFYN